MIITPRQREEWEKIKQAELDLLAEKIDELQDCIDLLIKERDRVEATTVEDGYFEFLAARGSER